MKTYCLYTVLTRDRFFRKKSWYPFHHRDCLAIVRIYTEILQIMFCFSLNYNSFA
jgi:hypothetical protein